MYVLFFETEYHISFCLTNRMKSVIITLYQFNSGDIMKKRNIILIVSGFFTLLIMAVMNILLIPSIEAGTEGMRFFDMNSFGYSYESAETFLTTLSAQGKETALNIQLPLDFVYPVVYTLFFILLMRTLSKKRTVFEAIPAILFVSDYTENICTEIMLRGDHLSSGLAGFASTVTIIKSMLMYITFLVLIIMLIRMIKNKVQKKQ